MYIVKRRGPETVPYCSHEVTVIDEEETRSRTICCVLIVRKFWFQLCCFPVITKDGVLKEISDEEQDLKLC